jgi:hypothetical protein
MIDSDNTGRPGLPPELLEARPHPLGEAAQAEALRTGANLSIVADQLAVAATATEDLPEWLKAEAQAKQAAQQAIADADGATARKLTLYRGYVSLFGDLKQLRDRLAHGQALRAAWQSILENAPAEFQRGLVNGIAGARACLLEVCLAREAVKLAPRALEALTKQVAKVEADIATLQRENGFTPPTAAPVAQAPEAQPDEPEKKVYGAFRAEQ